MNHPFGAEPIGTGGRPSGMTIIRATSSVATALAALLVGAAGATIVAVNYVPAALAPRTVILGMESESSDPAAWTAKTIRDGWVATDAADRARACAATPAQLRAHAPHSSYDPARYDVETAIATLASLCK